MEDADGESRLPKRARAPNALDPQPDVGDVPAGRVA